MTLNLPGSYLSIVVRYAVRFDLIYSIDLLNRVKGHCSGFFLLLVFKSRVSLRVL